MYQCDITFKKYSFGNGNKISGNNACTISFATKLKIEYAVQISSEKNR